MGMDLETLGGSLSLLSVTLLSSPISSFFISGLLWSDLSPLSSLQLCRLFFLQNHIASAAHEVVPQGGFPPVETQRTQRHDHHKPSETSTPGRVAAPRNPPDLQQQQPASPRSAGAIPGFSQGGGPKTKHQQ